MGRDFRASALKKENVKISLHFPIMSPMKTQGRRKSLCWHMLEMLSLEAGAFYVQVSYTNKQGGVQKPSFLGII